MTPALQALLLFAGWTLLLVAAVIGYRVGQVLLRGKPADSWTRGLELEDPGLIIRAGHAHLNALENLPVFAAIVLAGVASGQGGIIDPLAPWVLYARLAQTTVHLIGVNHWLVFVRAGFYTVQLVLFALMIIQLL